MSNYDVSPRVILADSCGGCRLCLAYTDSEGKTSHHCVWRRLGIEDLEAVHERCPLRDGPVTLQLSFSVYLEEAYRRGVVDGREGREVELCDD